MKGNKLEIFIKAAAMAILVMDVAVIGYPKKELPLEIEKVDDVDVAQKELPDIKQEVYSFRVEGFDEDKKLQWNLKGESAKVMLDEVSIRNLKGEYYGGDTTFTIFADKAVYNKKTQDIELESNIVGKTSDGGELVTDYAKWNAKLEEIISDSYVIVRRQNITCKGRGIVTKPRLKWVTFKKEVEVDIAPDKKITCSGPFEIDHEKSMAVFNNNVKIADANTQTHTDRLTVYLDPDTNMVQHVVTEGNVEVVHRGDVEDIGELSF